jgi:hypothetical protein
MSRLIQADDYLAIDASNKVVVYGKCKANVEDEAHRQGVPRPSIFLVKDVELIKKTEGLFVTKILKHLRRD